MYFGVKSAETWMGLGGDSLVLVCIQTDFKWLDIWMEFGLDFTFTWWSCKTGTHTWEVYSGIYGFRVPVKQWCMSQLCVCVCVFLQGGCVRSHLETFAQEKFHPLSVWEESRRTAEKCDARGSEELSLKPERRPPITTTGQSAHSLEVNIVLPRKWAHEYTTNPADNVGLSNVGFSQTNPAASFAACVTWVWLVALMRFV